MFCVKQVVLVCALYILAVTAGPDSAGHPPPPAPGISYGGIPYGSMSGNVAAYFEKQATSGRRLLNSPSSSHDDINFTPIEQWLR